MVCKIHLKSEKLSILFSIVIILFIYLKKKEFNFNKPPLNQTRFIAQDTSAAKTPATNFLHLPIQCPIQTIRFLVHDHYKHHGHNDDLHRASQHCQLNRIFRFEFKANESVHVCGPMRSAYYIFVSTTNPAPSTPFNKET